MTSEQRRLEAQRKGEANWRLWGPYLAERAWGSVREDYSEGGDAWGHFPHHHAPARAYRWNEDGLAGVCDEDQRLCLALALWNGRDPILKERPFGLTGPQGSHGEDVKELFFYLDATPSHSRLQYLYKYPQAEFPYAALVEENARRQKHEPNYNLLDADVFSNNRYFDVDVVYAKAAPDRIHARIAVTNRGPEAASLHLLPTLWFRNTWSWGERVDVPSLAIATAPDGAAWAVRAEHPTLGVCHCYGASKAEPLFTNNETNFKALFGEPNASPYVKDAFHRRVIHGDPGAVNPEREGTKFAAWSVLECGPGESRHVDLVLCQGDMALPFADHETTLATRAHEADAFFSDLAPHLANDSSGEDAATFRQAVAGMIWCKQFYHYEVARWMEGDVLKPPPGRGNIRNGEWRHLRARDVLSMPDSWEYPWFAAWDLAFHCIVFSIFDIDFAKEQLELLLEHRYLHPKGQIPAYEWTFDDANPPVHAMAVLEIFRRERKQRGQGDHSFLRRAFNKLVMHYTWWLNRKDADGHNVFEGGFLGLDNISVYDRSKPLPHGYSLKQADATGWMAMFALDMTEIAVELAQELPEYEDMAIQCYQQFLAIASAISGHAGARISLWDEGAGFYKDLIVTPDGNARHIDVYSYVGLIPLLASKVIRLQQLENVPRFKAMLQRHGGGAYDGHVVSACPVHANVRGELLLSLVEADKLKRILGRILNEDEFLSPHGLRSLSKLHERNPSLGSLPGVGEALIHYEPGESQSHLFGGNSNWRGPVWMPINYALMRALSRFHQFHGPEFRIPLPGTDKDICLETAVEIINQRLLAIFRRDESGRMPAFPPDSPFQTDPAWTHLRQFHEYFHGDTGLGLGASHQTGWTGLVANMLFRKKRPADIRCSK